MPLASSIEKQYRILTFAGDRTLLLTDAFLFLECTDAAAVNVTIPPFADVPFVLGTQISVFQFGAGVVTFVAGGGVTVVTPNTLVFSAQFGIGTIINRGVDLWVAAGAI